MQALYFGLVLLAGVLPFRLWAGDATDEGVRLGRVRLSTDLRLRWDASRDDHVASTRARFTAKGSPFAWFSLTLQAQDTRLGAVHDHGMAASLGNPLDLRLGYADFHSRGASQWTVRAGRQELPIGEERLIGSDGEWCHTGGTFDGVRLLHRRGPLEFDAFAVAVVRLREGFDRFESSRRIVGAQLTWQIREDNLTAAPYYFRSSRTDLGTRTSLHTSGARFRVRLPHEGEFASETAFQRGLHGGSSVHAWAGSFEVSRRLGEPGDPLARLFAGFVYASGDRNPNDGQSGTFDDLFSAGYNECGVVDPFAWRNIAYPVAGIEARVTRSVRATLRHQAYWLATTNDGLYADQGPAWAFVPQARSGRVGDQLSASVTMRIDALAELTVGVGRLFAGPYLRAAGLGSSTVPFVALRFRR